MRFNFKIIIVLLFLSLAYAGRLRAEDSMPPVIPQEVADSFGDLYVYYNGRVAPLGTLAEDYCLKVYGKSHWKNYSAMQVVTGWLFYYDWWDAVPMKLKPSEIGTEREEEKKSIMMDAASGRAFRIYPIEGGDWYSCDDMLPPDIDHGLWVFIRRSLDLINDEVHNGDWNQVQTLVSSIRDYQLKVLGNEVPPASRVRAEKIYNRIRRPMVPFMVSVTLGLLLFAFYAGLLSRRRRAPRWLTISVNCLDSLLLAYISLAMGLYWYVSGHLPFAGTWCMMMLMAWLSALTLLLLYRKVDLIQPLALILAGFTMLMASLASSNPQITPLVPALQSPLLSVHVLSVMISYTLLGLVALNGIMGLVVKGKDASEMLVGISMKILYPAVALLTTGIVLGSIWAKQAWGSYWSWDPKETWALITLVIYVVTLVAGKMKYIRNPRLFHWISLLAFASVLFTYFGVNFFLGGMHSYA